MVGIADLHKTSCLVDRTAGRSGIIVLETADHVQNGIGSPAHVNRTAVLARGVAGEIAGDGSRTRKIEGAAVLSSGVVFDASFETGRDRDPDRKGGVGVRHIDGAAAAICCLVAVNRAVDEPVVSNNGYGHIAIFGINRAAIVCRSVAAEFSVNNNCAIRRIDRAAAAGSASARLVAVNRAGHGNRTVLAVNRAAAAGSASARLVAVNRASHGNRTVLAVNRTAVVRSIIFVNIAAGDSNAAIDIVDRAAAASRRMVVVNFSRDSDQTG